MDPALFPLPFSIHQPPEAERIGFLQFIRQRSVGKVLKTNRSREPLNRACADGSGAPVGGRRIRPAVRHGMAHLDAGGKTVEDEAPGLRGEQIHQLTIGGQFVRQRVNRRRELAFKQPCGGKHFVARSALDYER